MSRRMRFLLGAGGVFVMCLTMHDHTYTFKWFLSGTQNVDSQWRRLSPGVCAERTSGTVALMPAVVSASVAGRQLTGVKWDDQPAYRDHVGKGSPRARPTEPSRDAREPIVGVEHWLVIVRTRPSRPLPGYLPRWPRTTPASVSAPLPRRARRRLLPPESRVLRESGSRRGSTRRKVSAKWRPRSDTVSGRTYVRGRIVESCYLLSAKVGGHA